MKKIFSAIAIPFVFVVFSNAQNTSPYWSLAGNSTATPSSKLGTTNDISLRFYTNNVQRMIINSPTGNIGIGIPVPTDRLHVNSATGANALRVAVNSVTKLLVHSAGGVSVGSGTTPPANGLFVSGNTGIGTSTPENKLHVFKGSAGTVTGFSSAPLIVENSTNSYINILAPNASATGILFGKPESNVSGGILYNDVSDNANGFDFRTNGNITQMVLTNAGNLGVGTLLPGAKLHVFKGSAGAVTGYNDAPLIVENATNNYINMLAPDASETGILFGKPGSNVSGGIIYNNSNNLNGFQFRNNGNVTKMVLSSTGNLGVGTTDPGSYRLKLSSSSEGYGLDIEDAASQYHWELNTLGIVAGGEQYQGELDLFFDNNFRGNFDPTSGSYFSLSDERLKTNIKPMSSMLQKIKELKPSTYQFKNTTRKQDYNGFIAQDVMKIFPAMVTHTVSPPRKVDVYTMDYSGFGVIAIKGIQELLPVIEEQKEKIATLEDRLVKLESMLADVIKEKSLQNISSVKDASLEQNNPNPVAGNTTIRYNVPQTAASAKLTITSAGGALVKTIILDSRGAGQVIFNSAALATGSYNYSLWVDGKQADTKQLIIAQ